MIILGIETSCDETAAAVLSNQSGSIQILSNVVASSASIQAKYGGIIPEQAAREQLKSIIPVVKETLSQANLKPQDLDAIAVTKGPGLIGSLLVGVETAKVLSLIWQKPLIPINHLIGHFSANYINLGGAKRGAPMSARSGVRTSIGAAERQDPSMDLPNFPCIGLLVSGGHTDLVLFKDPKTFSYLGGTRDDAAGECFDKTARLLGLPYPGGPQISKLAINGDSNHIKLPQPMINSGDLDFSFSGLKTAVANIIRDDQTRILSRAVSRTSEASDKAEHEDIERRADLAASIEQTIIDILIKKTAKATQIHHINQIMIAGGVAANQKLVVDFKKTFGENNIFVPPAYLCTDNAAMIAAAAFFEKTRVKPTKLQANPNLSLAN